MIIIGMNKINKELEIDRFLRGMIKMRIAIKILFSKTEQFLLRNNKKFMIAPDKTDGIYPQSNEYENQLIKTKDEFLGERF